MSKENILNILGIIFMIISILIMMNSKVALGVAITLWLVFTFMSLVTRIKAKKIKK